MEARSTPGRAPVARLFACAAVCVLVPALLYAGSLDAPFFFDDLEGIVENPDVRGFEPSKLLYRYIPGAHDMTRNDPSRPLTYLSFALNHRVGGLEPFGYHVVNAALHALCALLVFCVARTLLGAGAGPREGRSEFNRDDFAPEDAARRRRIDLLALGTALLFAAHPVHTEVAAYAYHRSESLALLFALLSFWLFARSPARGGLALPFSLIAFALALAAKQTAATLPALLFLYDWLIRSDGQLAVAARRWRRHLPFWLLLLALLVLRASLLGGIGDRETDPFWKWSTASYLAVQPFVVLRYLQLLVVPIGLSVDHAVTPPTSLGDPRIAGALLAWAVLFGAAVLYLRRWDASARCVAFGLGWFLVTLSPTSSFLPIADAMADRRLYLPSVGFLLACVVGLAAVLRAPDPPARAAADAWPPAWRPAFAAVIGLGVVAFGALTVQRAALYTDPARLWLDTLAQYPDNTRARNNLANLYFSRGDFDAARVEYERAIQIDPSYGHAHANLGALALQRGDVGGALAHLTRAVELNPNIATRRVILGNALLFGRSDHAAARAEFARAAELDPNFGPAQFGLGVVHESRRDYAAASERYRRAVELQPDSIDGWTRLGLVELARGNAGVARRAFETALRHAPEHREALEGLARARATSD